LVRGTWYGLVLKRIRLSSSFALKGKIPVERRKRPVMPQQAHGGALYVPRYAVAKCALSLVVNGHNALNAVKTPRKRKRKAA